MDITINASEKLRLIELVYNNATSEIQQIRSIVTKILFGIFGFATILNSWLLEYTSQFTIIKKVFFSIFLSILSTFTLYVINNHKKYFLDIAKVINKIDILINMYEKNTYIPNEVLFPGNWKNFGGKNWKEPIFSASYLSIFFFYLLSICLLWF